MRRYVFVCRRVRIMTEFRSRNHHYMLINSTSQRYFLAEILKTSNIPATHLLGFIEQLGIQPLWNEIALPNGMSDDDDRHLVVSVTSYEYVTIAN